MLPLVLIPGLLCDAALWSHQRQAFRAARPVIVADHTTGASITRMARMLLSAAPPRFALGGLSMGGYVALEVCRLAPDRVDRLALLDTNAHADAPASSERRRAQVARAEAGDFKGVVEELVPMLVHPALVSAPQAGGVLRAMAARAGAGVFARQQQAIISRRDQRDLLPTLAQKALVLCGADDALTPPQVHREMAEALPNAELVILEACGHLAPLEQPEAVTEAFRRWLDG